MRPEEGGFPLPPQSKRKQYCFQALTFVITFFAFATLHLTREVWVYIKDTLEDHEFSSTELGAIDMFFLFFYSGGLYVAGTLSDNFNVRYILTVMFFLVGLTMLMTGFGYIWGIKGIWWYYLMQALNGLA